MPNAQLLSDVERPARKLRLAEDGARARIDDGDEASNLSLSQVNRRRAQLWTISVVLVMTLTAAAALLSLGRSLLPTALQLAQLSTWIVGVLIAGLTLAFLVYVWEKERSLRTVTNLLVEERVHSSSLADRVSEMARLAEVGKVVNSALDSRDVFETILASALDLLGGTEGSIALRGHDGSLAAVAYKGGSDSERNTTRIEDGVANAVAARRRPMLVDAASAGVGPPGSSMCVPLIRNGDVLGVLNVSEAGGPRRFGPRDLEALGFFAEHAAVAIGNSRLFHAERETVARLKELDQLKSDFVATVSHELRTPLTAIIGAAKTLARRGPSMDAAQREAFMDMIQRQAERLLRLAQDVLTASRMEADRPPLRRELVELRDVVDALVGDLSHTALGERRRIVVRAEPERPQIWGDSLALEQVLTNLIDNALKYSAGEVRVEIRETEAEVAIEVADDGDGIPPDQFATIFERFRQAEASLASGGGFGLGLFIVKNLVDAHNGSVDVRSEVGAGTTFSVRLPKHTADR